MIMHDNFETEFEVKFLAEGGVFEGYASVFNETDSVRDRVAPGAFTNTLEKARYTGRMPPLLWQHDGSEPIGAWRVMREDAHGLYVKGELFVSDIPRARQAYKLLTEGVVTGLSIGYRAVKSHRDKREGARVLTEVDLQEVSLVTFPALSSARIHSVKASLEKGEMPDVRAFEVFLRDAGFSRRQAKMIVADGYRTPSLRDADGDGMATAESDTLAVIRDLARSMRDTVADFGSR